VSATGPERGFGIVLSWAPRAFLRVDAAYDAFFDINSQGVHRSDLSAIRLHDKVLEDEPSAYTLAQKQGGRYLTRVQCDNDSQIYVHDDVIVLVNREVYRLNLQTTPERYTADVQILNAMLRSWRWQTPVAATHSP
jgi:hypothetical protein